MPLMFSVFGLLCALCWQWVDTHTDILSGFPLVVNQMIRLLFTLEIPVYTPFRYDEGSQTHTEVENTKCVIPL